MHLADSILITSNWQTDYQALIVQGVYMYTTEIHLTVIYLTK